MMGRPGDLSYRFEASGHWGAGAMVGFETSESGIAVAATLAAERIAGSEAGTIAAAGSCGRLVWLRKATGEVVALHEFGAEPQGRIGARRPRAIHPGASILWVRGQGRLHRYAARTLQELGEVHVPGLVASASDGCDGLWLLVRGEEGASVRWLAADGRFEGPPIALRDALEPVAIASDPGRRRLAILDSPAEAGEGGTEWRLHLVDLTACEALEPFRFTLARGEPPPRWIAIDPKGGFHLASASVPVLLTGASPEGIETSHQALPLPHSAEVDGLLWLDGLVLDCDDGLYRLRPAAEEDEGAAPARAVFITPTLASPPDTPSGWNRAEIAVELPRGADLKATVFASSSAALARDVEEALAASATMPAARLAALEALLAKDPARQVRPPQTYQGEGAQVLHLLLDRIPESYLWLRIEIASPPGAGPARIGSLRVRYPDRSWLDELPAIYRDEPGPAVQLRQFLAPFEALYAELDEAIDRLPALIDPDTAGDERLSWLLGWLGFPPTAGLSADVQRRLLKQAGPLLEARGTLWALRTMLEIVTDGRVEVEDGGGAPGFWVVGTGLGRLSPRLGSDTHIVSRRPLGFRPGSGMRLGEEPLPPLCTDVGRVLRAKCALVAIRISVAPDRRAIVLPIIDSLLAMFVPAHCAIDIRIAPAGRTRLGGRLDRGWRLAEAGPDGAGGGECLADPDSTELGSETEAGAWQLPRPEPLPFAINGNAPLDGPRRLA